MNIGYAVKTKKIRFSFVVLTMVSVLSHATPEDHSTSVSGSSEKSEQVFTILNRLEPAVAVGVTYFSPSKVKKDENAEVSQIETYLNMPLTGGGVEGEWQYFVSLNFNQREFEVKNDVINLSTKAEVYGITVPVVLFKKTDEKTAYLLYVAPGLRSSLHHIDNEDFGGDAIFQLINTHGIHSYQYGAGVISAFGESKLVPIVSYSYQPNAQLNVTIGLPTFIDYAVDENQSYFARLSPTGGQWHSYEEGKKDQGFDFTQEGYRLGLGGEWALLDPLWLKAETGMQFGQEITLKQSTVEKISFKPSLYVGLSLNMYFD